MNRRDISQRLRQERGQALIEFVLVLPMIFLLIVNLVNFGGFFYAWITVANAARAGADYAVLSVSSIGGQYSQATAAKTVGVITTDLSSLPNNSTASIKICQNNNTSVTSLITGGTCGSVPLDPEPTSYVSIGVDVTYTYQPFIPAFSFPQLGVYLTLPPTTIERVSVMRSLQ